MTNGAKCPPECEFRLDTYKEDIDTLEGEMKERPRTRTLFLIFGPIITLMLFFVGWSFSSIKDGQTQALSTLEHHQTESMATLKSSQEKIESKLDMVREMQIKVMSKIGLNNGGDK